jgi:hypothetical protein
MPREPVKPLSIGVGSGAGNGSRSVDPFGIPRRGRPPDGVVLAEKDRLRDALDFISTAARRVRGSVDSGRTIRSLQAGALLDPSRNRSAIGAEVSIERAPN